MKYETGLKQQTCHEACVKSECEQYIYKYKILNEGDIGYGKLWKKSGTRDCIPHPYIFVQLLQDSEA